MESIIKIRIGYCCCVYGLQLLPSVNKAVAVCLVEFSHANVTKFLKEAAADPTWLWSTSTAKYGVC